MPAIFHQHRRSISTALLVVLVTAVLQFCMMSMAEGQISLHDDHRQQSSLHSEMIMGEDDCCAIGSSPMHSALEADTVCPDCEEDEQALQTSQSPDLKPLYALLYVTVQAVLNDTLQSQTWLSRDNSDILTSFPKIYLAKVSFLE